MIMMANSRTSFFIWFSGQILPEVASVQWHGIAAQHSDDDDVRHTQVQRLVCTSPEWNSRLFSGTSAAPPVPQAAVYLSSFSMVTRITAVCAFLFMLAALSLLPTLTHTPTHTIKLLHTSAYSTGVFEACGQRESPPRTATEVSI